jgi:biopolymer transport protein ExbD/biopolymer transport protein TolR
MPDINVTPLVDVVLVLLIIFMVVAPRMDQDVPVDLPGIFNPDPEVETAMDPVKLSVAKAGRVLHRRAAVRSRRRDRRRSPPSTRPSRCAVSCCAPTRSSPTGRARNSGALAASGLPGHVAHGRRARHRAGAATAQSAVGRGVRRADAMAMNLGEGRAARSAASAPR